MLLDFEEPPEDLSLKPICLGVWTTTFGRVWLLPCAWAAWDKPGVELRKAQPDKMITPLVNKELIETFLFTPRLSNNVKERLNKYVVPQQNIINLDLGLSSELQKRLLVLFRSFVSQS